MDTTTIQEIANQLGIGVNEILQYLPGYAQSQFLGFLIPTIALSVATIISITVFIIFAFKYKKYDILYDTEEDDVDLRRTYRKQTDFYAYAMGIAGVISAILLIIFIIVIPLAIGPMLCWANSPELMLLKSLIPT